jgi:uncharacterized repeat protein (TIGR01451 family)
VSQSKPALWTDSPRFRVMCEAVLAEGSQARFRVRGMSMQPNLLDGDTVVVAPAKKTDLRRGDIVLSHSRDGLRVHRFISVHANGGIVTRGDAGQENDPEPQNLAGRVIAIERNGKRITLSQPGQRLLSTSRTLAHRLRLAASLRLKRLGSSLTLFGFLVATGILLNATPAAAQADLTMSQATSVSVVDTGINFTYTEIATNKGPNAVPAGTLVVYQQTPPNTTLQSITVDANWNCSNPGTAGPIICIYAPALASGANTSADPIVFTLSVNAGTAYGTTILNSATVTSQTTDPVPSNNTSVTTVLVEPGAQADMAISMSAAPTPVFLFSTLTYTIQVQNLGQANAATVQVADTIPAGTTFVSANAPAGWTCSGTTAVTCTLTGTMARGASATITISVTSPSTAGPITNTATVSSSTTDPVAANNSATVITVVQPLVCATPGKDGIGGTLSGVVNTYYRANANGTLAAGANTVTLAAALPATGTPIAVGDLLLIIQLQDALINNTNTSSYGHGVPGDPAAGSTNLQSTGQFEYVTATSAVPIGGGALTFTGTGANGGALNTYVRAAYSGGGNHGQQRYEVIRVPQYTSATLSSALVPLPWDGNLGGVLAIDVASQLTLGGTVSADALGFRGGGGLLLTGTGGGGVSTDYVTQSANTTGGPKGEGIAGTPRYVAPATIVNTTTATNTGAEGYSNGSFERGAPGNAGGGCTDGDPPNNDFNCGGGGGGNGGSGGLGGYGWNSFTVLNSTDGGFGGAAFPATTSAVVMGGGGGAGGTNNGSWFITPANHDSNSIDAACSNAGGTCTGIYSSGGMGGGIVIVHTGTAVGTGTITSNGQSTLSTDNDGTGGAGAGGSIIFFADTGTLAGLTANANGGSGGNTWPEQAPGTFNTAGSGARHGPGGGGSGGVILLSGTPAAMSVAGGLNGYTNTVQDSFGATPGQAGVTATNHLITETPGAQPGAYCASADLAVTNAGSPNPVLSGGNITYTQTVTNNGPLDALNAVFTEAIPANTTFQSINTSLAPGWTCVTPAVGGTGTISCTNPDVAKAAVGTFTVVVQVPVTTPWGTQIVDVAQVSSGTNDPNLANNSAIVTTAVASANTADIAVTNTPSALTVLAGSNVTFTQVVTNNGPAAGPGITLSEPIPANTTFVSGSGPAGWSCSATATTITCSAAALAANASASLNIVLNVTAGTAAGTVITDTASVGSGVEDPNTTNNIAAASVTVATAGQADLLVTSSASPNPVLDYSNITFTQKLTNNGPSTVPASSNVQVTDTIPANTIFVSFTNPNAALWNCVTPAVGATGTITCTYISGSPAIAVGQSFNFPVVVEVSGTPPPTPPPAVAPGTKISNTITVTSTVVDPTPANRTATSSTFVAAPTQADVAIIKTASPEPVNQGTNLTYTLQVTNNGPAIAQGVVVNDPLPSQVTYTSASTTQGSCTYTAGTTTVNCPIGTISVGGLVIITINVNASTFSSGATASNTATVTATTSDPNGTNNTSTAISTIQSPTAVQLVSFRTLPRSDGTMILEWKTREEVRNLGFNVYREDGNGRHRLNPALIAGSALVLRYSQPQHAAKTYLWLDRQPTSGASYWLEDVDLDGSKNAHGPAQLETSLSPAAANIAAAPLLTHLNQTGAGVAAPVASAASRRKFSHPLPVPDSSVVPVNLENEPAVKISVQSEGWCHVTRAQLLNAGLDPRAGAQTLQLFAEGIEQPILILGNQTGQLGPNDAIEFYGTGIDTPFSDTRVYWLVSGRQIGKRIPLERAFSGGSQPQSFAATAVRDDRTVYFAALLNGEDQDNFFGALVTSEPVDQELDAVHSVASSLPVTLDVTLQGVTDAQEHSVSVVFNGALLGNINFSNQANFSSSFPVDPSLVQDGANTVTLTALDGDNDVSLVQTVVLHYAHSFTADNDWLSMQAAAGSQIHVSGFSNPQIRVFDITNPLAIEQLPVTVQPGSSAFSIDFGVSGSTASGQPRTLVAVAGDQIASPSALVFHARDGLRNERAGASVVIITHPDFAATVAPLVRLREQQGYTVKVVTIDEIFDAYNFGERSPHAMQQFLHDAAQRWRTHPRFVLLVGDASLDPRNYLGFGDFDFVPTRLIDTAAMKTASDDWFTDFNQSGFATIPTGRLPVRTAADAELVISKIVSYESGATAGTWNQQALVVADQNIGVNFSATGNALATSLGKSFAVTKILADQLDPQTAKQQLLDAINGGQGLVDYVGHGSVEQWSFSDLLDDSDAAAMQNGERLPVFLLMDCLNGFFQDVYTQSLAESLLLAPNGGAVAVWASSGFTDAGPQSGMDLALTQILTANPKLPLGLAILQAKSTTGDRDVRRTWILFGDPAMHVLVQAPPQGRGIHGPTDPKLP